MTPNIEIPWVEKYRPKDWQDIVSQNIAINNLKRFVESGDMPHLIFTGPAGTGKTSTAMIVAKNLIGEKNYYRSLLELNASDTVRMDYVRKSLKSFVDQSLFLDGSIKIVILDEADNIPSQVQQALRRIIEKSSSNVKFILLCNYINRIIDPIISRCAVFRFVNLPKDKIIDQLKYIAKCEKINIPKNSEDKFFETLFFVSGGDLRKAINSFQMSVALELIENLEISEILKISGYVELSIITNLKNAIQERDLQLAIDILHSIKHFDSRNFLRQIVSILPDLKLSKSMEAYIYSEIGEVDYRISQGSDKEIQLSSLISDLLRSI